MPVINFNGVKKIYRGGRAVKKVYLGENLVWKERRVVTGRFFGAISYTWLQKRTTYVVNLAAFNALGISPSDVAYYVGKSGTEYPLSIPKENRGQVDIPQGETYTANENHTLILKD